ncbi:hypothetical protein C5167_030488 [Papaver somniferum]|nr:hypothetical protein C5167_030488 [Papaver somniferum]
MELFPQFYHIARDLRCTIQLSIFSFLAGQTLRGTKDLKKIVYIMPKTFHVTYHAEECSVHCTCQKFTFDGIPCRHALSVLCHNGVKKLPDKCILGWWRKDGTRAHTKVKVGFSCWTNDDAPEHYHDLCTKLAELAALAGL